MLESGYRPKICFLTDVFITGGVERVIIEATKILSVYYDITLYVYSGVIEENIRKEIEDFALVESGNSDIDTRMLLKLSLPYCGGRILENKIKKKYDCVIVCKAMFNCAAYCNIAEKYIYWNHSDKDVMYIDNKKLNFFRRINKRRLSYIYKHYDLILNLTPEIDESVSRAFHLSNSEVLPNPIDCRSIVAMSKKEQKVNIDREKLIIVSVGRLSQEKGFCRLIRGLDGIDRERYQFFILGDGVQYLALEDLIRKLKLEDNVHLLGTQKNPYWFIKNADLLVSASETESFGLTMLEAMILKTPVLATNTVGARFVLKNGLLGKIVYSNDELHENLNIFINNPATYQKYIEKAFEYANEFDIVNFERKLLKCVQNVLIK